MESIVQEHKIHFYQYMEVELLHEYIHSGIKYFVNSFVNFYPSLIGFRYYTQQLASLLSLLKDVYFLVSQNALYAEYFYGLERTQKMTKIGMLKNMVIWFIIPYIFRKLQAFYKQLKFQSQNGINIKGIKKFIFIIFPFIYAFTGIIQTFLKFKYLIKKQSQYYNAQYLITKVKTQYRQTEQQQWKYPILQLLKSPGLFILLVSHKMLSFFFGGKKGQKGKDISIEQIVAPLQERERMDKNCPICGRVPKNAAFLKASGYVFCYTCIHNFVESEKVCPMTKIPVDSDSIQIIYE